MHGDYGNHRGRREALENIRHKDQLARQERQAAESIRNRLEKRSVNEGRSGLERIVAMAACDQLAKHSVEDVLDGLRRMAQAQPAIARAHNAWMARRRVAAGRPLFEDEDDARDEPHITPVSPQGRAPGVVQLRDSGGSIDADARTRRDHFGGGIHDAMQVMSYEDYHHMMRQRMRSRFY